jgi:hypothetical protein
VQRDKSEAALGVGRLFTFTGVASASATMTCYRAAGFGHLP